MRNIFGKKHTIIVMDATSYEKVMEIVLTAGLLTKKWGGLYRTCPLSEDHQNKFVIQYRANDWTHYQIQWVFDTKYPGLCIYDPKIKVLTKR